MVLTGTKDEPLWRQFSRQKVTAQQILDHFEVRRAPVPVYSIIMDLGITMSFVDGVDYAGAAQVENGAAYIWIKRSDAEVRKRFTAAHELAHTLLHGGGSTLYRDYIFGTASPLEAQANRFAANLLMPPWLVKVAVNWSRGDTKQMAEYFGVSETAMGIQYANVCGSG